jgi:membrane protein implicated in regulation of membrane protease activity
VLTVGAALAVWVGVLAGLVFAVLRNWQVGVAVLMTLLAVGLLAVNVRELAGRRGRRPGGRRER